MSLLWNDSLTYSAVDFMSRSYLAHSGFSIAAQHPKTPSKTCLSASIGSLSLPASPTGDTAVLGFYMKASAQPASFASVVNFRSAGGTVLVNIQMGPGSRPGTVVFRALTGDAKRELFRSWDVQIVGSWAFIEWKILFSNNGYIELRVNGTQTNRYENVDTNTSADLTWTDTRLTPNNASVTCYFSDLYLGDTSGGFDFLGPCSTTRLFPGRATAWGWGPSAPAKKRLVILAGQSNINGRGQLPYWRPRRNPNGMVSVWNNVAQAWQDVQAGIGSHPFYGPQNTVWSFEMSFADRIAALFEATGTASHSNVYILRLGADAAAVSNIPPEWVLAGQQTFYPNIQILGVDVSLSNRAFDVLVPPAIAALGGWSEIEKVDIVWFQGESEASLLQAFISQFVESTNVVFDYFEDRIPMPVTWHRIMCQRLGWREGSSQLFPKIDQIRALQRGNAHFRGNWIDTEEYDFWNDGVHMSEEGSDALGLKVFESWLASQAFTENVKNYFYGGSITAGDDYHGYDQIGTDPNLGLGKMVYAQAPELQQDLVNSAVVGVSSKLLIESSGAGTIHAGVGGIALPGVSLSSDSAWTMRFSVRSGFATPEAAAGSLEISVT